jgi:hypothetical protein
MNLSLYFDTSALLGGLMDSSNNLNGNKNLNLNMSSMSFGTAAMSSMGTIGTAGTSHGHATSHQTLATSCLLLDSNISFSSHDESYACMISSTYIGTAIGTDDASACAMTSYSTTSSNKSGMMSLGDVSINATNGTILHSSSSSSSAMISLGGNTSMGGWWLGD